MAQSAAGETEHLATGREGPAIIAHGGGNALDSARGFGHTVTPRQRPGAEANHGVAQGSDRSFSIAVCETVQHTPEIGDPDCIASCNDTLDRRASVIVGDQR